ncbi:MAG: redoxin domain-containing protein [Vicinamibacterales bacterium]
MKHALIVGLLSGAVAVASAQQPASPPRAPTAAPPPPPPAVKVGEPMPHFTLSYLEPAAEAGGRVQTKQVKLSDYKGKQAVVLAFFPAAFSPG